MTHREALPRATCGSLERDQLEHGHGRRDALSLVSQIRTPCGLNPLAGAPEGLRLGRARA